MQGELRPDLIIRTKRVAGIQTPGVIHNGNYFFVNLSVFADGIIDCWELVDLSFFKKKLKEGWVVPSIPEGESISIHHLGDWQISGGNWDFNQKTLFKYVKGLIKTLNPKMENLHNCHGHLNRQFAKGKGYISILGETNNRGEPSKKEKPDSFITNWLHGKSLSIFCKQQEQTYLADLRVFKDASVQISRLPEPVNTTISNVKNMITEGTLKTQLSLPKNIHIHNLGSFNAVKENYSIQIEDFWGSLQDIYENLNERLSSSDLCQRIYKEYMENPTVELRRKLRTAYEKIPQHERIYVLGDQDVKDIPVRMIIYGDQEIEKWAGYVIAKEKGWELPVIKVPKPKDE